MSARGLSERGSADVADDPDDLGLAVIDPHRVPHRALSFEEPVRGRLADDDDGAGIGAVLRPEEPAITQRDAQRTEVAAGGRLPAHLGRTLPRGQRLVGSFSTASVRPARRRR